MEGDEEAPKLKKGMSHEEAPKLKKGMSHSFEHLGDASQSRGGLQKSVSEVLQYPLFDGLMAVVILLNFGLIVVEADMSVEAHSSSEELPVWIVLGGWIILALFSLELSLRIFAGRFGFFRDGWNCFDFAVVGIDACLSCLGAVFADRFPVSAIRILRLCKLARVTKVFRVFPELRIMLAGILGSVRAIFWGMVLFAFALIMWAVIGVNFVHPLNVKLHETGYYDRSGCERCPHAFSSVARALLTLLEQNVAGESWTMIIIPIMEAYPVTAIYFVGVLMTVGMAVLNLILGVVVNVAMESRDELLQEIGKERIVHRMQVEQNLLNYCEEMDLDHDGLLSKRELMTGYKNNAQFRGALQELNVDEEDLEILWTILDPDKEGNVPYADFISRSYSMKNSDHDFVLAYIKFQVCQMKEHLTSALFKLQTEEEAIENMLNKNEEVSGNIEVFIEQVSGNVEKIEEHMGKSSCLPETPRMVPRIGDDLDCGNSTDKESAGRMLSTIGPLPLLPDVDQRYVYELINRTQILRDEMSRSLGDFHSELASWAQAKCGNGQLSNGKDASASQPAKVCFM